jgi:hypothetical protein
MIGDLSVKALRNTRAKPQHLKLKHEQCSNLSFDEQRTVANFDLIRRFSELTDLPITDVGCGSTPCVGNATVFINSNIEGASSFVVELPRDVSSRALDEQAQAFLAVAEMATQNIFAQ